MYMIQFTKLIGSPQLDCHVIVIPITTTGINYFHRSDFFCRIDICVTVSGTIEADEFPPCDYTWKYTRQSLTSAKIAKAPSVSKEATNFLLQTKWTEAGGPLAVYLVTKLDTSPLHTLK